MEKVLLSERVIHLIQIALIVTSSTLLIVFAHQWVPPDVVYTSMITLLSGTIATHVGNGKDTAPHV